METLLNILINRDGMAPAEAQEFINKAREAVANGADPEEILYEDFGLEPDYLWELV